MRMIRNLMAGTILGAAATFGALPVLDAMAETPPDMLVIAQRIDDITTLDPAESFEFAGQDVSRNVYSKLVNFDPLDLKKGYRVTLNNYLAERGIFKQGTDPLPGVLDLDALEAYVEAHSPLAPPVPGRLQRK